MPFRAFFLQTVEVKKVTSPRNLKLHPSSVHSCSFASRAVAPHRDSSMSYFKYPWFSIYIQCFQSQIWFYVVYPRILICVHEGKIISDSGTKKSTFAVSQRLHNGREPLMFLASSNYIHLFYSMMKFYKVFTRILYLMSLCTGGTANLSFDEC